MADVVYKCIAALTEIIFAIRLIGLSYKEEVTVKHMMVHCAMFIVIAINFAHSW